MMIQNPVYKLRTERHLTQEQAAAQTKCHVAAWLLQEKGCYPDLLPAIIAWLVFHEAYVPEMQREYHEFQKEKRRANGERHGLHIYELGAPGHIHPFVQFRMDLGLSRQGFAKAFCVHPGLLYRLEQGIARSLSSQVRDALRDGGMTKQALKELIYRIEEIG